MALKKQLWIVGVLLVLMMPFLAWGFGFIEFVAKQMAWRAVSHRDYRSASAWADDAKRWSPGDGESEFLIARIARKQARIDDCVLHLKRAGALGFDRERIRRELIFVEAQIGNIEQTVSELSGLLVEQQGDGVEICEAFTNGLLMNGMENEAKTLIQQWSTDFPEDPQPDVLRGRLAEFHTRPKDAEQHYRAALTKLEKYPPALFGLARTLSELNRWQEALEVYQHCLDLHPPVAEPVQWGIARCLRHLGREDEAYNLLKQVAAVPTQKFLVTLRELGEPTENDLLATELGTLEANRGHFGEAVRWLQQAVDHNPKHRAARYQLAKTLQALGKADQAQSHFEFLSGLEKKLSEIDKLSDQILKNTDDLEVRFRMGVVQLEVGSKETGLFWLRSVVARDPAHSAARDLIEKTRSTKFDDAKSFGMGTK